MKYCTKCGAQVSENAKYCNKCGSLLKKQDEDIKEISTESTLENDAISKTSEISMITDDNMFKDDSLEMKVKERTNDLEATMKLDLDNLSYEEAKKENDSNIFRKEKSDNIKNKKNRNSDIKRKGIYNEIMLKGLIVAGIVIMVLCGVFFNKISSRYYMMKCNNSSNIKEKIEYAAKAVECDDNNKTVELLKDVIVELSKTDTDLAQEKLNELSTILTQSDIKNISIGIKEKKIDMLCSSSSYEEALKEFEELDKLGVDFKKNKHYDDVMLNVISKATGCVVKGNKDALMEDESICYDNFDGDIFDEVVEVKQVKKYDNTIKVNLYKYVDGKYRLTDSKTINNSKNKGIQGTYDYEEGHKGIYVSYTSTLGKTFGTSVYSVDNSKLSLKGIVYGNNYTKVEDVNNDGIYEVISSSIIYSSVSKKEVRKVYSIHDDGRAPTEVADSNSQNNQTSSDDYILPDSNSAYLTEEDLRKLSKEKLALARNEIFARHGYVFKEEPFKSYFEGKSWYSKNPGYDGSDSALNNYEKANYKVIQDWEKK